MEATLASDRYEKTWQDYLLALSTNPSTTLSPFLSKHHVNKRSFWRWMSSCGYSVHEAKARLRRLSSDGSCSVQPADSPSFSAVVVTDDGSSERSRQDILTGVSLTLPDGTIVSIRRGSAEAVVSFLKLYSGEGNVCSD